MAELKRIIYYLEEGNRIPSKYSPHQLKGRWIHHFECHLEPDWLIIWNDNGENIKLVRTGSHSELFR